MNDWTVEEIPEVEEEDDPTHPLNVAINERKARSLDAKRNAQALRRAGNGWSIVRDDTNWQDVCDQADEEFRDGTHLLKTLGGQAALDPLETATLINLRSGIIRDLKIEATHEYVLLDQAIQAYAHSLRMNRWIGDLAYLIEHEAFCLDSPPLRWTKNGRLASGLTIEEHVQRLQDGILPMVDRANRMFLRALQGILELRRGSAMSIAVAQLNVGSNQINVSARRRRKAKSGPPS